MLNASKSAAVTARLSLTVKFCSHRLKYPTSTDTPGSSFCCTDAPNCQSLGRTPQPSSSAGSKLLLKTGLPKFELLNWPHTSPPAVDRFCAFGFSRSQSGTKLPLLSVHERVTAGGAPSAGLPAIRTAGLVRKYVFWLVAASRYLPTFTLIAVLPLPNRSYAMPPRGVM